MAGDVVGGYDHTLKEFAWGVVKATKKSIKQGLVSLFAAGTLIAQPTMEHPIWTENHHDYVAAQDLKIGDTFLDGKGATLRLDSLAIKPDTTLTVYNFEVNDLHNYYVGTQEVLVHNDCATISRLITKGFTSEQITKLVNATKKAGLSDAQLSTLLGLMDGLTSAKAKAYYDKVILAANNATTQQGTLLLKKWLAVGPPHGINVWDYVTNIQNKPEYFEKLMTDLTRVNGKYKTLWDEIKNDATNAKFELWKSVIDDPSKAIQKIKEEAENVDLSNAWTSLGGSTFWQDFVRGPGKLFESEVVTKMITDVTDSRLSRLKAFLTTTRGYTHNTQVYLKRVLSDGSLSSKPIAVDNLLTGERKLTGDREWNGVFNDAKLTDGAGWTANQKTELIDLFTNDPNLTEIKFQIRSNRSGISTGQYVIIKRENVFKTQYNGSSTEVRTLLENKRYDDVKAKTEVKPVF